MIGNGSADLQKVLKAADHKCRLACRIYKFSIILPFLRF
jgi:hypothetical protein